MGSRYLGSSQSPRKTKNYTTNMRSVTPVPYDNEDTKSNLKANNNSFRYS